MKYLYKICAPGIDKKGVKALRKQIARSLSDPDYAIVTNYEFSFEVIPLLNTEKAELRICTKCKKAKKK